MYDGEFEAQMCMIFDANKQRVHVGDIYPSSVKLPKGQYTIRVLLRHDRGDLLAKFKTTALLIERTLDEPIVLKCHKSARGALVGNAVFDKVTLPLGGRCVSASSSLPFKRGGRGRPRCVRVRGGTCGGATESQRWTNGADYGVGGALAGVRCSWQAWRMIKFQRTLWLIPPRLCPAPSRGGSCLPPQEVVRARRCTR